MRRLQLVEKSALPSNGVFGRDIALANYRRHLGKSYSNIYYDAAEALHPNAFAAVSATLCAGGTLFLHLPKNYLQGDGDHHRLLDYDIAVNLCNNYFNRRLRRIAATLPTPSVANILPTAPPYTLRAQVILGRRGRGKSTYLANKINWLLAKNHTPIIITSPFADNRLEITRRCPANALLLALPPDEICRQLPKAAALIIDEAAAISLRQLLILTTHYPHFTLASSEEGYEGSGRHFTLTTLPLLQTRHPNLQIDNLHYGYRYRSNDILENQLDAIFLRQSQPQKEAINIDETTLRQITAQQLFCDEQLLQAVYEVFYCGHYRNRPEDIKRLLDLPNQYLYAIFAGNAILALLHVLIEQPLPADLIAEVIACRRRPRGRLLMQQLLIHSKDGNYARKPLARISRIVTIAQWRRRGLAAQLIAHAQRQLPYRFGVSYAAQYHLDQFWQQLGFCEKFRAPQQRSRHLGKTSIRLA